MSSFKLNDLPDELLICVLRQVPIERRVSIRTVSRKWYSIILDIGYHVDPLFMDDKLEAPHFSKDLPMKLNPAITWNPLRLSGPEGEYKMHTGFIDKPRCKDLLPRRSEFITSPPISVAHVHLTCYDLKKGQRSERGERIPFISSQMVLRTAMPSQNRSEGIRIGDLLDIYEKMRASSEVDRPRMGIFHFIMNRLVYFFDKMRSPSQLVDPTILGGICPFFVTCEDGMREASVTQKACGKNGIEIRTWGPKRL